MVLFNYSTKEITAKIVYYGPGLCGKTTNLQFVHSKLDSGNRGKLLSLATEADRTLFFDFLPLDLGKIGGFHVRFQLYTVPGQVHYNATRRMVLKGVDAVVFVADSQVQMMESNRESFRNLGENLIENGYQVENIPVVLQANKRDLPNIAAPEEIFKTIGEGRHQIYEAVACRGDGVFETLKAIIKLTVSKLKNQFQDDDIEEPAMEGLAPPSAPPSYEPQPLFNPDTPMVPSASLEDEEEEVVELIEETGAGRAADSPGEPPGDPAIRIGVSSERGAGRGADSADDSWRISGGGDAEEVALEDEISFDDDDVLAEGIGRFEEEPEQKGVEEIAPVDIAAAERAVEAAGLEGLEAEEPPAEIRAAVPEGPEAPSSALELRVEELAREVRLLREENRSLRAAVENILAGIGRQIAVLGQIRPEIGTGDEGGGEKPPSSPPREPGP
jgi:signal recognition particle receptor subunit beta